MKVRQSLTFVFAFILVVSMLSMPVFAEEYDNSTITFSANIFEPVASINAPREVFLGDITKGYETNATQVIITNTGNLDITVTPLLASPNAIFENLYFSTTKTGTYRKIGSFSMNVSRPNIYGGEEEEDFYVKLNLENYDEEINTDRMGYSSEVILWVMPRL